MNGNRYPLYGAAAFAAAAIAVWAGFPPALLLIFLACPLMMFFMMRGMNHGGGDMGSHDHPGADEHNENSAPHRRTTVGPTRLDGSHERIDHP